MTETDNTPKSSWPESAENLTHTRDWFGAPDPRLQWMADMADTTTAGIGITLVIAGGVLSGTVISGPEFFKKSGEQFRSGFDEEDANEIGEQLAESFYDIPVDQMKAEIKELSAAFEKGERSEPRWPLVRHIHLQEARLSIPGQGHMELNYTRVLLSQVIAWSTGTRSWGNR